MSKARAGSDSPEIGRSIIAGAVGGMVGAIVFGLVLWAISPEVLSESIPEFYGIDPSEVVGWALHLSHGVLLGIIFGFIASRSPVQDMIMGPVETEILSDLTAEVRMGLLGVVYGIAIWVLLPFIGLSLLGTIVDAGEAGIPGVATEMILGHVLFGVIVGIVFAVLTPMRTSSERR